MNIQKRLPRRLSKKQLRHILNITTWHTWRNIVFTNEVIEKLGFKGGYEQFKKARHFTTDQTRNIIEYFDIIPEELE